jgi:hypothetical protein
MGSTAAIYLGIAKKYGMKTLAYSHGTYKNLNFKTMLYIILSYPKRFNLEK